MTSVHSSSVSINRFWASSSWSYLRWMCSSRTQVLCSGKESIVEEDFQYWNICVSAYDFILKYLFIFPTTAFICLGQLNCCPQLLLGICNPSRLETQVASYLKQTYALSVASLRFFFQIYVYIILLRTSVKQCNSIFKLIHVSAYCCQVIYDITAIYGGLR